MTYVAQGQALADIKARKESLNYVTRLPRALPSSGQFYSYLLSLSRRVPSWTDYKAIVESLPGIADKKDRFPMAKKIFDLDRKKDANRGCALPTNNG